MSICSKYQSTKQAFISAIKQKIISTISVQHASKDVQCNNTVTAASCFVNEKWYHKLSVTYATGFSKCYLKGYKTNKTPCAGPY